MKIYMAGCESTSVDPALDAGLIHCAFVSYLYARGKPNGGSARMLRLREQVADVIVDSGAHTFFAASNLVLSVTHKKASGTEDPPELYWAKYLDWAIEHQDSFDYFVELDIGEIIGQSTVYKWREQVYRAGDALARKFITVFHPVNETRQAWRARLKEHPSGYVGLEGFPGGKPRFDHLAYLRECYEAGVRVHGFAMTKQTVFKTLPFYSVDSSSFLMPQRYGNAYVQKGAQGNVGQMRFARPKDEKEKRRLERLSLMNELPLDVAAKMSGAGRSQEAQHEGLRIAARNCARLQNDVTSLWRNRGVDWERLFSESHRLPE